MEITFDQIKELTANSYQQRLGRLRDLHREFN